ncbi:methyltransferase domain protein [Burkholderia thailandensis MSMB121]|uniref:class I SAM-dependent methyltransferase n=1 Tax=Burkholderia humptydooensis TaxID=430531 RepID=UPI000328035A|nr:class I SAM-dependent methyltransferase [Burkholderia humptydooensis]AGK48856.1 methyltransferase domain protein [Burkholderia thailandensis MSMB121]ATF34283.1 class I SAM-dependent methyltransferase [Burkholderia thailandensis]KST74849.1 methyltransferase [Burkholderia humptydooensis]
MDSKQHWEAVYRTKAADALSWYRPHLDTSLRLIDRFAPGLGANIIDVGGGESTLVDDLLARGYEHVTVADVSSVALDVARRRLGDAASRVQWMDADITQADLPANEYDVWHDRAVFHFLTERAPRRAYVERLSASLKSGGCVVIATFGPAGPARCSGLDVVRYGPDELSRELGAGFALVEASYETHRTPADAAQQFLYCVFRKA